MISLAKIYWSVSQEATATVVAVVATAAEAAATVVAVVATGEAAATVVAVPVVAEVRRAQAEE